MREHIGVSSRGARHGRHSPVQGTWEKPRVSSRILLAEATTWGERGKRDGPRATCTADDLPVAKAEILLSRTPFTVQDDAVRGATRWRIPLKQHAFVQSFSSERACDRFFFLFLSGSHQFGQESAPNHNVVTKRERTSFSARAAVRHLYARDAFRHPPCQPSRQNSAGFHGAYDVVSLAAC